MDQRSINLADADCEPTDEELQGLVRRAFADVSRLNAEARQRLEVAIERDRRLALARVAKLLAELRDDS